MAIPRWLCAGACLLAWTPLLRADFVFVYDGRTYVLVQTKRTWDFAQLHAIGNGGVLARIDSAGENAAILRGTSGRAAGSTAPDGGDAIYLWIGGREITEGNYSWVSAANQVTPFWTGGKNGAPAGGLYNNWGRNIVGASGPEPDNFGATQNQVGFALGAWPVAGMEKIGQPGQWNDINGANQLYGVIEIPPPPANPSAPSNLQVTTSGKGAFELTWQDNASNETAFLIHVDDNPEDVFFQFSNQGPNTESISISGGLPHHEYRFMVRALLGESFADSNVASVMTAGLDHESDLPSGDGWPAVHVSNHDDGGHTAPWIQRHRASSGPWC